MLPVSAIELVNVPVDVVYWIELMSDPIIDQVICASVPLGIDQESIFIVTAGTMRRFELLFQSASRVLYAGIAILDPGHQIVEFVVSTYCAHGTPPGHH